MEFERLMEIRNKLDGFEVLILKHTVFIAVMLVMLPLVYAFVMKLRSATKRSVDLGGGRLTLLKITVFSLLSVFMLRYSVGLYDYFIETKESLLWWEELSNSLVHALQTFSMDEDYTTYVLHGKEMVYVLSDCNQSIVNLYSGFVLFMNIAAPVVGGAMLLGILTSLFPNIKLFMIRFFVFNKKYYFSRLNERSLAMATSVIKAYKNKNKILGIFPLRPAFIFCDVYTDREEERDSELLAGARAIGSICVRDDLIHVKKNCIGGRNFVLIDDDNNDINSLKMFTNLVDERNADKLKKSEIFLFVQNDLHVSVEDQVYERLKNDYGFRDWQLPVVTPIKCYRNLVYNLLADLPLYEPLVDDKKNGKKLSLDVSILGGGVTGTEMLLATYWFGQILDCELNINVFSQESEKEFYEKLNYINPDIDSSTKEDYEDLPYCNINYVQTRVDTATFFDMDGNTGNRCLDSDYIFVALGSDETNIRVANKLREEVGRVHLKDANPTKTIITYVVYDSGLCDALNEKTCFDYSVADGKTDIYMRAVGALSSVYSVENVFCTNYTAWAENTGELYDIVANSKERRAAFDNNRKKKDYYYTWADRARAMHIKYKIFSAGFITTSVFDTCDTESEAYKKAFAQAYLKYDELAHTRITDASDPSKIRKGLKDDLILLQRLAWLEHRRWNAYLRTNGFRTPDSFEDYMVKSYNGSATENIISPKAKAEAKKRLCLRLRLAWNFWDYVDKCRERAYDKVCAELEAIDKQIKATKNDGKKEHPCKACHEKTKERLEKKKSRLESLLNRTKPAPEHKHIPLKLHPCIARMTQMTDEISPKLFEQLPKDSQSVINMGWVYDTIWEKRLEEGGFNQRWKKAVDKLKADKSTDDIPIADKWELFRRENPLDELWKSINKDNSLDPLDRATFEISLFKSQLNGKNFSMLDYKQYDYPNGDVSKKTVIEMKKLLNIPLTEDEKKNK